MDIENKDLAYPKISIITPNYNGGQFLEETIKSILGQKYPNLEYIIIDGGSTDNSIEIIKKYESKITYWVSEPDKGMYDAIRKGFEKSTGEIMAWLNSDDMYHRNSFFCVADIFQELPQVQWLSGIPTGYDEKGNTLIYKNYMLSADWSKYNFYTKDYTGIQQESLFWRKSLLKKIDLSIWDKVRFAGDFLLWQAFFKFEKLYVAPVILGGFRVRSGGQLSYEYKEEYLEECYASVKEEYQNASFKEKLKVKLLFLDKYFVRIPLLKRIYLKFNIRVNYLGFPKNIIFDRTNQGFYIND